MDMSPPATSHKQQLMGQKEAPHDITLGTFTYKSKHSSTSSEENAAKEWRKWRVDRLTMPKKEICVAFSDDNPPAHEKAGEFSYWESLSAGDDDKMIGKTFARTFDT